MKGERLQKWRTWKRCQ